MQKYCINIATQKHYANVAQILTPQITSRKKHKIPKTNTKTIAKIHDLQNNQNFLQRKIFYHKINAIDTFCAHFCVCADNLTTWNIFD